jgi:hypothetical protein
MKDILGLVIVVMGASIFERGFKMLSPDLQTKFAKEMHEKMSAFLTKRAADVGRAARISNNVGRAPRR